MTEAEPHSKKLCIPNIPHTLQYSALLLPLSKLSHTSSPPWPPNVFSNFPKILQPYQHKKPYIIEMNLTEI
jgi:hypothetical protein